MARRKVSKRSGARRFRGVVTAAVLLVAGLAWGTSHAAGALQIEVLSNRADLISGGDALVRVELPSGVSASDVTMKLGAIDVTSQFELRPNGEYEGLVTGLELGANTLKALLPDNSGAQITITNHPSGGPVFAGPQVQPWDCNLGAVNDQCDRQVSYAFSFMSLGSTGFRSYDPANPPPAQLIATTKTDQGNTVPFVVRVETGAVDRGEYSIAVLYDPAQPWQPWAAQAGWNHKLFVKPGAGCSINYNQGTVASVLDAGALGRGFAVLSTSLISSTHNCEVAVQAESLMMAKERLIEAYGPVRYTFGIGGSGASMAQHLASNSYPGLYQGLIPSVSFPDGFTQLNFVEDCNVLKHYWLDPTKWAPGVAWAPGQLDAVAGASIAECFEWPGAFDHMFYPSVGGATGGGCPAEGVYEPQTNPNGVRCTLWDYTVSQLGRRDSSSWGSVEQQIGRGFANRPIDNVGVQYGLNALMAGLITPAQFADMNAKVGGHDIDYNWQPERNAADLAGLENAYRAGLYNQANNMDEVAILDLRGPEPGVALHDHFHSWSMRARLDRANGHHDNHVIWWGPVPLIGDVTFSTVEQAAFDAMDRWLANVEADSSGSTLALKIASNKPADVRDRCTSGAGVDIEVCTVPANASPRMAAGGPLTNDVIKCQLKALDRTSYYPVTFIDADWAQLEATFPGGVCDFSKPGIQQQPTVPWQTYAGGPGGQPLGAAPVSTVI